MLTPNISEQNAFIRMIGGFAMTSIGTARLARNPKCMTGMTMVLAGAMKIAEGFYEYCPLTAMMQNDSN